jgi:hypothetical protein
MSCKFCGRTFNRGFNLRRHEKNCPLKDKEREMSETESQTMDSEDDASRTSTSASESQTTTDSETETEEEKDPWTPMVEEAMQKHEAAFEDMKTNLIHNGLEEKSAAEEAYFSILPMLQRELESIYMERLLWMKQLKIDPVHKKIMQTKHAFEENDEFDPEEAMEAAVNKRKFLIKRILKDHRFTGRNDDEDE